MEPLGWIYLALGTVTSVLLGALWYSPLLFAKPWMTAMGLRHGDVQETGVPIAPGYFAAIVYALGQTALVGLAARTLGFTDRSVSDLGVLVLVAGTIWLVTSALANLRLKFFEDRPWSLYLIDEGANLATYLLLGVLAWALG